MDVSDNWRKKFDSIFASQFNDLGQNAIVGIQRLRTKFTQTLQVGPHL